MAAMTKQALTDLVSQLVRDCETYRDALSIDRIRAMEYYDGVMKDVPSDANRSKVVSRDVRAAVKKVLPSLVRTVLGNDKVVEYEPVNQGDEAGAEQATDYINYIVFPESDGYDAVQDAAHDALKLRNGVIRWWYEKKQTVEVSSHTGLDEQALVQLIADDAVEVLEQSQSVEAIELPTGRVEQPVFNVKIRRTGERGTTRLAAVPLEEFLIHPDAISIDDSPITGINRRMRRSDLIAMGYDRAKVEGFAVAGDHDGDDEAFIDGCERGFVDFTSMGVTEGTKLTAGVVFHNYAPEAGVIELSAASTSKRWLTRPVLKAMFGYPLDEIGCQMAVLRVSERNTGMIEIARRFGFDSYRIPRLRGRGEAEIIFTLTDNDWRAHPVNHR